MNPERPLDGVRSIKAKLGLLVATSIVAAALVSTIGDRAGVPGWFTLPVTVAAALGVTQWLARGMTSPLREMTAAAAGMATGDYSRRVTATSADEVGILAHAFNTMAADLAGADSQRRQLVATVSHELRTPLAAQQALLENLVDGVVRPDDAVLRSALAQAERLGGLVGDLLDLSRVDGGRTPLVVAPVDVRQLAEAAVAEAGVSRRGTEHVVDVPAGLHVTADGARLRQLLANLLDNADRHSPPGGRVTVSAGPEGPDRWWLLVADEGSGIPAENAERIFDRFGSGDDAGGGTGIGLAIASWVCELHGGSIVSVPPPPGEHGARLRAVLPRCPLPSAADVPDPATTISMTQPTASDLPDAPHAQEPFVTATPPTPATAGAPVVDSLFGDLWPEAGLAPQVRLLLLCVGVGIVSAVVLPYRNIGLALFGVLVLGGAVLWRTTRRPHSRWTALTGVLCVSLASLSVLRAAEWLTVLAVVLGIVLLTTALTDARRLLPLVAGVASWPLAAVRGLPLLGRTVAATSRIHVLWPVVRTAAVSLVALVVFGGLFASGDAVFGSWAGALVPHLAMDGLVFRTFVGFVMGGALLAAAYVALNPPHVERVVLPGGRPVTHPWEWLVPVGLVVALFLAFVVAQATALFGGHAYVQRTTGLTYADYVHQGFGQLTVATLLTVFTVALAARKAPRATSHDRLVLRIALGSLCALTLLVVASALHRMDLYQQAYGFTVLRVVVDAFELWLGLLVVLVLVAGVRLSGWWLPRAALVSAAAFVLVGGLVSPEAWVAERNLDRYSATGRIDLDYLRSLGPDAAPVIAARLSAPLAPCLLHLAIATPPDDLLGWNVGRARARQVASTAAAGQDPGSCTTWLGGGPLR
ncbi:DUF4153 domain-containing protein [Terrabacter sp. BE26]|uniref:DUF4153 domain-containing protein n=1 Tax=Terrabacter sp. BE26 TaxID=2898152 RepID=UPI0035BE9BA1